MGKIVMWGVTTTETEEQKTALNALQAAHDTVISIQRSPNKEVSVLNDCIVLLKHDTDGLDNQTLRSVQWTVICSGSVTQPSINEINKTAGIPASVLIENLENFIEATNDKTEITKEDIEILYAIDPKLEKLLEPFATANPFNANDTVKQNKDALNNYIKSKS